MTADKEPPEGGRTYHFGFQWPNMMWVWLIVVTLCFFKGCGVSLW